MKASKFTGDQKAFIIKQGEEGTPVAEICRKAGISQATYFNRKKDYAGMLPTDMKKLRELENENKRLEKIVADLALGKEVLQDVINLKLRGLLARQRWSTRLELIGRYPSVEHVVLSGSTHGRIGTSSVGPIRPRWNSASKKSARHPCGLAIGASMCFCARRGGRSLQRKPIVFTRNWACSCAIRHQNGA